MSLTLCVPSTYIYVLLVPCKQPLYMHLECIKDVYTTSLVVGKNLLGTQKVKDEKRYSLVFTSEDLYYNFLTKKNHTIILC